MLVNGSSGLRVLTNGSVVPCFSFAERTFSVDSELVCDEIGAAFDVRENPGGGADAQKTASEGGVFGKPIGASGGGARVPLEISERAIAAERFNGCRSRSAETGSSIRTEIEDGVGGALWDVHVSEATGEDSVIVAGTAGDLNQDGVVERDSIGPTASVCEFADKFGPIRFAIRKFDFLNLEALNLDWGRGLWCLSVERKRGKECEKAEKGGVFAGVHR